ncbi:MAG: class I SAM-dependent methyltransferase [Patescibacteria group bacterium]|nr:class I SAM-dependent methyltransferase [Patescibacteria group bacterium]
MKTKKTTTEFQCPVCGSASREILDKRRIRGRAHVNAICGVCGMVWVVSRQPTKTYEKFYRSGYAVGVYGLKDGKEGLEEVLEWRVRRSREKLAKFDSDWESGSKVLEIGSGIGALLKYLRDEYGCRVWGIEPEPVFAKLSKEELGLNVFAGTFDRWSQKKPKGSPAKYDRIVLDQVLEHILEPVDFLERVVGVLEDDGKLFISVPNVTAPKDRQKDFFIFEHVSSFSPFPLWLLLARCGLKIVRMYAEKPGSLQVLATKFGSSEEMIDIEAVGKPQDKISILKRFNALEKHGNRS